MGQLTNLYVSESYQGLIKLADSTTGVTGTLQYLQDGLGNRLPIQMSTSSVNITGSLFGTSSYATQALSASYAPDSTDTGSLVTTSSFNAFTASIDGRVDALEIETGSLQNQINQKLDTGSFNTYTSSNDSKVNSLIASTGSYATTSSLTSLSQSIALTDLNQDNVIAGLATTSSVNTKLDTGSFNSYTSSNDGKVNSLIAATGSFVTEAESGSFMVTGSVAGDTLTFTKGNGSQFSLQIVVATGSLPAGTVSGSAQIVELGFATTSSVNTKLDTGSFNTYSGDTLNLINQKLDTGSFNSYTSSNDAKVNSLINATGSYATTGSNNFVGQQNINSSVNITGSLNVTGEITALSASITYLETIYQTSSVIFSSGSNILGDEAGDTQTLNGVVNIPLGNLNISGSTTSSLGFFGNLQGTASFATNALSSSHSVNADTASYVLNAVSSSYSDFALSSSFAQNAISSSHAINADNSISSSQAQNAVSASHSVNSDTSISSSFAQSAISSSHSVNSDTSISSSYSLNSTSSSFAQNAISSSHSVNSDNSISSSFSNFAVSSSFASNSLSSSHAINADTASFATTTISSSYAENAGTASFAKDIFVVGKNTTGVQIDKGTVVRIAGSTGDQALIVTASWEDDSNSANTLGILSQDIANDASGSIITTGTLIGINTSGFTAGDILYLSSSGQYTNVIPPAPYHEVRLGQVLRVQQNVGSMYVQIQNGYELSELHDVDITSPVDGDLLVYRSGSYGQWVNEDGAQLGFATTGSNTFVGNQTITGSLIVLGNENVGNLNLFSTASYGNASVQPGAYITASAPTSQSNLIFASVSSATGQGPLSAVLTGSIVLSGSNNILFNSNRTNTIVTAGTYGYLNGYNNILSTLPTLNTGSSYRPFMQGNIGSLGFTMTLGSGSGNFSVLGNYGAGTLVLNLPSGSVGGTYQTNNIAGTLTIQQPLPVTSSFTPQMLSNNINGQVGVQLNSSSIQMNNNNINGTGVNITGSYIATTNSQNVIVVNNNNINGLNHRILFGGVSTNSKGFNNNTFAGGNITASLETNDTFGIANGLFAGQGIFVKSSPVGGGGSTFVGRYNDSSSLAESNHTMFAVGTGTAASTRRTSLWVTSGSLVGVSGSLQVIGDTTMTGSLIVTAGITGSLEGTSSYATQALSASYAPDAPLPSGVVSGSAQIVELGFAETSSLSSYVLVSQTGSMSVATASYVLQAVSASYATDALTASFALNAVATDTGSLMKTGSVAGNILTFTKGDGTTFNLTVDTGSAFPFSGSAVITGSLLVSGSVTITGSVQGNVNALSISSNTASLDLNNGNFFTLQLVSGSATHINPSNIKPGQTINILLSTTGSGTVNFPSSVKQISGSAYVPTTTTSKDIITLVSFDSTNLYLANVKNLI